MDPLPIAQQMLFYLQQQEVYTMTKQQTQKEVDTIRRVGKEAAKTKESALKFLVAVGICTPSGKLTKPYR